MILSTSINIVTDVQRFILLFTSTNIVTDVFLACRDRMKHNIDTKIGCQNWKFLTIFILKQFQPDFFCIPFSYSIIFTVL